MLFCVGILFTILVLVARYTCDSILEELSCTFEEGIARQRDDEEVKLSEVVVDLQPPKYIKQKARRMCCQKLNRQEALFPCGKCGIKIILLEFQLILNISLLSLIALIWHETTEIYHDSDDSSWLFLFIAVAVLFFIYSAFYILPVCVRKYMLITNVTSNA